MDFPLKTPKFFRRHPSRLSKRNGNKEEVLQIGATVTETAQKLDFSLSELGIAHDPSTLARRALAVDSQ